MSEMSIYSSVANDIAAWLFLSTILSIGGYKALHTGWVVRRTDPMYSKHITQRTRYAMVLIGLACTIPTVYVFIRFGAWDVLQVLGLLTEDGSLFGWAITIMTILAFFYVPIAVIASFCIMLWPSPFASRKGSLYRPTAFVREGNRTLVPWIRSYNTYNDRFGQRRIAIGAGNADHFDMVNLSHADVAGVLDPQGVLSPEQLGELREANPDVRSFAYALSEATRR